MRTRSARPSGGRNSPIMKIDARLLYRAQRPQQPPQQTVMQAQLSRMATVEFLIELVG